MKDGDLLIFAYFIFLYASFYYYETKPIFVIIDVILLPIVICLADYRNRETNEKLLQYVLAFIKDFIIAVIGMVLAFGGMFLVSFGIVYLIDVILKLFH